MDLSEHGFLKKKRHAILNYAKFLLALFMCYFSIEWRSTCMFKENNLNAIILAIFGFSLQFAGFGLTPEFNPWTWVMWTVWAVAANRLVRHFSSGK